MKVIGICLCLLVKNGTSCRIIQTHEKSPQQELSDELDEIVALYEIAPVHKQLVRNIKWYNQNKA